MVDTNNENAPNNFETIIAQEVGGMDLDSVELASDKVSEVVGESASENSTRGQKKDPVPKKTGFAFVSGAVSGLLFGTPQKDQLLPPAEKQRKVLKKALVKRTRTLVRRAAKIERSKKFSASQLEEVMLEIRHLQQILKNLARSTIEKIETLYRRYVLKA